MEVFVLRLMVFMCFVANSFAGNSPLREEGKSVTSDIPGSIVILVSCDGFRWGYQWKEHTPNIRKLISQGTEAEQGLVPVYPTLTFPNHYSIATGLYPAWHGIVNNNFRLGSAAFTRASEDPKWWLGEPIWSTVVRSGLEAVTYFWPGSGISAGAWNCSQHLCPPRYNGSVPYEDRVDQILATFDEGAGPNKKVPSLVALYLDEPDTQAHDFGPDSPEIDEALLKVDKAIGRLLDGIKARKRIANKVNLLLVGDHGMVSNCESRYVFLEDLAPWLNINASWIDSMEAILSITPPGSLDAGDVLNKMKTGLLSNNVTNGKHLKLYLKEDLPKRLKYYGSPRIQPIIGIVDEGYAVAFSRAVKQCGGSHGYDNKLVSMRSIFIGKGPRFGRGRKVKSFENVNIYNIITSILGINAAPNNGTESHVKQILLPEQSHARTS